MSLEYPQQLDQNLDSPVSQVPTIRHSASHLVTAISPGTFGELVQGYFADRYLMVTIPIDRFSTAWAYAPHGRAKHQLISKKSKLIRALDLLDAELGDGICYTMESHSSLPVGKGLASSTADLVAGLAARFALVKKDPTHYRETIARILNQVEPTDGIMYPGQVMYAHHEGKLIQSLGAAEFTIVGILPSQSIDTVDYDSKSIRYSAEEKGTIAQAIELVSMGIRNSDLHAIGKAATLSAWVNQKYLEKPALAKVQSISDRFGGKGIIIAHSGTAMGVIMDSTNSEQIKIVSDELSRIQGEAAQIFKTWNHGFSFTTSC